MIQAIEELADGAVEIRVGGDHPYQAITSRIFATGETKAAAVAQLVEKLEELAAELEGAE